MIALVTQLDIDRFLLIAGLIATLIALSVLLRLKP